jgi:hypothetical protein
LRDALAFAIDSTVLGSGASGVGESARPSIDPTEAMKRRD